MRINNLEAALIRKPSHSDLISKDGIIDLLEHHEVFDLTIFDETDSTNDVLKEMAKNGAPEWTAVIARRQNRGRGRLGRSFVSPEGGLYMSLLLRPELSATESLFITTAAAVSVAEAIESMGVKKVGIKWVNDIYIDNRKVCGILTEGAADPTNGRLSYAILGIGVNVITPDEAFPDELKNKAGSIFGSDAPHDALCSLTAAILNRLYCRFSSHNKTDHLSEYRSRSVIVGKNVTLKINGKELRAKALNINDDLSLLIKTDDDNITSVLSGDVTVTDF